MGHGHHARRPGRDRRAACVDACVAWFARVDDLFSTWRPDTEIMRIGRGELRPSRTRTPMSATVLELCEQMRLESHGAFDITFGANADLPPRPGRAPLDPSGLVKGWAVARAGDDAARRRRVVLLRRARAATSSRAGVRRRRRSGWRVGDAAPVGTRPGRGRARRHRRGGRDLGSLRAR